jgi:prevent-host-death family protein
MKLQNYTATNARANFFELIKAASENKTITEISMNGKVVAKLIPAETSLTDWEGIKKDLQNLAGSFTAEDAKAIRKVRLLSRRGWPEW